MDAERALVERFYRAFGARDHATMGACYSPAAHFSDPVFTSLDGSRIGAMWRMLCERGTDLVIEPGPIEVDGSELRARWDARYTFSGTGRPVHNKVTGRFRFKDGLILDHRDDFDFGAWLRMALGPTGWALGWTPFLKNKVRRQAAQNLDKFIAKAGIKG